MSQKAPQPAKLDLLELQRKQLDGEVLATQKGNTKEGAEYEFPTHEADRFHVQLTRQVHVPEKKEYVPESKVVKLVPTQYDRMQTNGSFDEYDAVEVLHSPRGTAAAKPTESQKTGAGPMEPVPGLPTLQDAQMRYKQLTSKNAPAVGYEVLIEFIRAAEADSDEQSTDTDEDDTTLTRKPVRSLADAQTFYKEVFKVDAPADKSFTELKALIEAELNRIDEQQQTA